jgi:uncharacterized membrane protein
MMAMTILNKPILKMKNNSMLKETSIFMYQMVKLLVIGLPIAIILYLTANIFFESKRIIKSLLNYLKSK